jgi:hypothetical protein
MIISSKINYEMGERLLINKINTLTDMNVGKKVTAKKTFNLQKS